ncbi:hypothetical protein ACLOJK_018020 [Asimina triloba]
MTAALVVNDKDSLVWDQVAGMAVLVADQAGVADQVADQAGAVAVEAHLDGALDLGGLQDGDLVDLVGVQADLVGVQALVVLAMVYVAFCNHVCGERCDHRLDQGLVGGQDPEVHLLAVAPAAAFLIFCLSISPGDVNDCLQWGIPKKFEPVNNYKQPDQVGEMFPGLLSNRSFTFCAVASFCKSAVDQCLALQGLGAHLDLEEDLEDLPSEKMVFG